jgi:hypothetical protein
MIKPIEILLKTSSKRVKNRLRWESCRNRKNLSKKFFDLQKAWIQTFWNRFFQADFDFEFPQVATCNSLFLEEAIKKVFLDFLKKSSDPMGFLLWKNSDFFKIFFCEIDFFDFFGKIWGLKKLWKCEVFCKIFKKYRCGPYDGRSPKRRRIVFLDCKKSEVSKFACPYR